MYKRKSALCHHVSVMQLGHLLTRSGLAYPEVSSKVCHDSFCQSGSSVSLPWAIYCEAYCLHVVSIFSCIPAICPKLVLFLTPLQFAYLFCDLCKCSPLFFSCISSLRAIVCRYSLASQKGSAPCTASRDIQISPSVISRVLPGSFDMKRRCLIGGSHSGLSKHSSIAGCDAVSWRNVSPATLHRSPQYLSLPEGRNWRKSCLPECGPTSAFARVICGLHSVKARPISGTWINFNWFLFWPNVLILIRHSDLCIRYTKVLFPIVRCTSCIKRGSLVAFSCCCCGGGGPG